MALALTGVFGSIAALCLLLGLLVNPVIVGFAVPFGVAAYFLWYHASGGLHRDARARAERTRADPRTRAERARADPRSPGPGARGRGPFEGGTRGGQQWQDARADDGDSLTEQEAYRALGLDAGADAETVRRAYRERVKEVHPDRGGDEDAFRRVTAAYRRLRE